MLRTFAPFYYSLSNKLYERCVVVIFILVLFLLILSLSALMHLFLVENKGVEPLTLCVQGRCSSQLS